MPRRNAALLSIYCYLTLFVTCVYADDTEIFFGGSASSTGVVSPNVLFILDTSGSMSSTDGLGVTRLDRMKEALSNILTDSNNINVGLMRFSNPGGPVLYPIKAIDGVIESGEDAGDIAVRVNQSTDDAEQASILAGGAMSLNADHLTLVEIASGGATSTAVDVRINNESDDVEESAGGSVSFNSSDLEFVRDNPGTGNQIIGLRFNNVNVPQGATITAADVEFEIDERKADWDEDISIRITGQAEDDAPGFGSGSGAVSGLPRTTAFVDWVINTDSPPVSSKFYTSNIADIIQETVNRGGWSNNNSLVLIFERTSGTGERTVESYNGESNNAPLLRVDYTSGSGPAATDNQIIGLRFNGVEVPQGAIIHSASIQLAAFSPGSDLTSLNIKGETADNSVTFDGADFDVSNRTYTTAMVSWPSVPAFSAVNEAHSTPDLATVVQEIVSRSGWCGGNSMSFKLEGAGLRLANSYESDPSQAPYLRVNFDPDSIPASPGGCINKEVSSRVNSSSDDAEESSSGYMSLSSSDLELVRDGSDQKVGVRFRNVQVAQGSAIISAYIEFTADETSSQATSLTFNGHDVDNSGTFTSSRHNIGNRTTTTAAVSWNNIESWDMRQAKKQTPDLSSIVQEIVDRGGWTIGNSMSFIISGSGKRVAESNNGSAGEAPRLVIRAQGTGGAAVEKTVRSRLIEIVEEMQFSSSTPIVDTLYEGALYYRGEPVDYGARRGSSSSSRRQNTRVSHPESLSAGTINQPAGCTDDNLGAMACINETITGGVYQSPIDPTQGSCQKNYIVLLTDGSPTVNTSAAKVKNMAGISTCQDSGSAACGQELAKYLFENDQLPGGEIQNVTTYTIGFNFSGDFIREVAENGGGTFYEASTSTELAATFESIIKEILKTDASFVSPGASVNQFNRLTHRNELYFSLFKPDDDPKWAGNLKRYQLHGNPLVIADKNGAPAIDEATGFFKTTATSFWSTGVDGNQVAVGGAAANLPTAATRNMYTYYSSSTSKVLSNSVNNFAATNSAITKTLLGIEDVTDQYRIDLMNWTRGLDLEDIDSDGLTTDERQQLGDPLHSKPILVTYGGTSASPDITLFFTTNEGFLHGIDPATGAEVFSFIPEELLPNLDTFKQNVGSTNHPYGLDGSIIAWVNDVNDDNQIDASAGDHVYLYFGMRRGGRNYYALDVTDRNNPTVLWTIKGGISGDDFEMLGQTWSVPVKTRIEIGSDTEEVLIFGGGYHPGQDDATTITPDAYGNAVYMVRAGSDNISNGGNFDGSPDLLWSAGNSNDFTENLPDMDYSIPSDIKVLDMDLDGFPDQMYVGDMGGQLWRFDLHSGASNADSLATAGVIGRVSGTDAADNRRFYHAPDASIFSGEGTQILNVAIGSGWQAHPLNEVIDDRFYSFHGTDVHSAPATYVVATENELYDATDNLLGTEGLALTEAELAVVIQDFESSSGWYIRLEHPGEKVLAKSLTVNNQTIFTTYEPNSSSNTGCTAAVGTARAYVVSVANATPVLDFDNDGDLEKDDRQIILSTLSIAPEPIALMPEDAEPIVLIGPESPLSGLSFGDRMVRTYWYQTYETIP
jgi:type IV pilus assembly protein PilY1